MAPVVGYFEQGTKSSGAINGNEFNGELAIFCFSKAVHHEVNCQCIVVLTRTLCRPTVERHFLHLFGVVRYPSSRPLCVVCVSCPHASCKLAPISAPSFRRPVILYVLPRKGVVSSAGVTALSFSLFSKYLLGYSHLLQR